MGNDGFHEQIGELSDEPRDMRRALPSLMEELEGDLFTDEPIPKLESGHKS